jgi:hypothetical protein
MREIVTSAMTPFLIPGDELCLLLAADNSIPKSGLASCNSSRSRYSGLCSRNALTVTRYIRCSIATCVMSDSPVPDAVLAELKGTSGRC